MEFHSSHSNDIIENSINTTGDNSEGMLIHSSFSNVVKYNLVKINGTSGRSIHNAIGSDWTIIKNNTIEILSQNGVGIFLDSNCDNVDVNGNTVNATNPSNTNIGGIQVFFNSFDNDVMFNTINIAGFNSTGINFYEADRSKMINNTINMTNSGSRGIFIQDSTDVDAINNTINTSKNEAKGIWMYSSDGNNNIINNNITTEWSKSYGIFLDMISVNDNIIDNRIDTTGSEAHGINVFFQSSSNKIIGNSINTSGADAAGIKIDDNCNLNDIKDNTIHTNSSNAHGISVTTASNQNDLNNNEINTTGQQACGVYVSGSNSNDVTNNNITATRSQAHGIQIHSWASDTHALNNTINVTGTLSHGIYLSSNSNNNDVINNTINVSGPSANAISLGNTILNNCSDNKVRTRMQASHAVRLSIATNNTLYFNKIKTYPSGSNGIDLDGWSDDNIIAANNIRTYKQDGIGIKLELVFSNDIVLNVINTSFPDAHGIYLLSGCHNNDLIQNNITTQGSMSRGIYLENNNDKNDIIGNTIITEQTTSAGILIDQKSTHNVLLSNVIDTKGQSSPGILLDNASYNSMGWNVITTYDTSSSGIKTQVFSNDTSIHFATIRTKASGSHGISVSDSYNTFVNTCDINTTGANSYAFKTDGIDGVETTVFVLNTTLESQQAEDFMLTEAVNVTAINCNFDDLDVTQDSGGVLQVINYLHILVNYIDNVTPIVGADIKITDNGAIIYASSGYSSGPSKQSDSNGSVKYILVPDRWYIRDNTATENQTEISVKYTEDASWEEIRSGVKMLNSHTEYFTADDIKIPSVPTGLSVTRIAGKNDLKISWNANIEVDIVKYVIYSNRTGTWAQLTEVDHPQLFVNDTGLADETWYHYKIQAKDADNLVSAQSAAFPFYLTDITPPQVPAGLNASPVSGSNAINITWLENLDDTIMYEVEWKDPGTSNWVKIGSTTDPKAWFKFTDEKLVHRTIYSFRIRAIDKVSLASNYTDPFDVEHLDFEPPTPPLDFKAVTASESQINLMWDYSESKDVEWYRIMINETGSASGGPYKPYHEVQTLEYKVKNLKPNTAYYFVVKALDEAHNPSANSNEAWNRTLSVPPNKPVLNDLPNYTNVQQLNVSGTGDLDNDIFIYINDNQVATGSTDSQGKFRIEITLDEDDNVITAKAINPSIQVSDPSDPKTVILDTRPPTASAGPDIEIKKGDAVTFDASASSDNYGIDNYTWSLDYGSRAPFELFGEKANFVFNITGIYTVTLSVTDLAGNSNTDTINVDVKTPVTRPKIVSTSPGPDETGVPIDSAINITFSLSMNKTSVKSVIVISPTTTFSLSWSESDTLASMSFNSNLSYNSTYTVTIGIAESLSGETLENAPYQFSFTTELEVVKPVTKEVKISEVTDKDIQPGETITISGTTAGIEEGTIVNVTIDGESANTTTDSDGKWSVSIKVPDSPGDYTLTVGAGDETTTGTISVAEPVDPDKKEDKKEDTSDMNMLYGGLAVIVIILILLALLLMMRKKKGKEEEAEAEEEEERVEEEAETEDEEEAEAEGGEPKESEPSEEPEAEEEEEAEPSEEEEPTEEEAETEAEEAEEEDVLEDEEEEELGMLQIINCPKCEEEIEVPRSTEAKVSMKCQSCGAKGRIKNPYL
jgi:hypothetical protein